MWRAGGYGGLSGPFNVYNIGGPINTTAPDLLGLQSFNVWYIPEPSTLALICLGALMLRRRVRSPKVGLQACGADGGMGCSVPATACPDTRARKRMQRDNSSSRKASA